MITPEVGKTYINLDCDLVVECVDQNVLDVISVMQFTGRVVEPGKLAQWHSVGQRLGTLNPSYFSEYQSGGES